MHPSHCTLRFGYFVLLTRECIVCARHCRVYPSLFISLSLSVSLTHPRLCCEHILVHLHTCKANASKSAFSAFTSHKQNYRVSTATSLLISNLNKLVLDGLKCMSRPRAVATASTSRVPTNGQSQFSYATLPRACRHSGTHFIKLMFCR